MHSRVVGCIPIGVFLMGSAVVASPAYSYMDYSSMIADIESLPSRYPDCARVYDARVRWPELGDFTV